MAKFLTQTFTAFWNKVKTYVQNAINQAIVTLTNQVSITYAELVALRNAGNLVPGRRYRITDFITKTTQTDTRSAEHRLDIIVTADSSDSLNEEARAVRHNFTEEELNVPTYYLWTSENSSDYGIITRVRVPQSIEDIVGRYTNDGEEYISNSMLGNYTELSSADEDELLLNWTYTNEDDPNEIDSGTDTYSFAGEITLDEVDSPTYFADSKLSAWKLKYCLDNDITRFAWADTGSGKGVIYYLEDEFGNLAEYDFKNIQFKRFRATIKEKYENTLGDSKFMLLQDNGEGWYDINNSVFELDTDDYIWCYTFHDIISGNKDGSLNHFDGDAYNPRGVFKNSIHCNRISVSYDDILYTALYLSNIVHYVTLPTGDDYDTEGIRTCGNEFGIECQNLTFSKKCRNSKFIGVIKNTTFGGDIWGTTFGGNISNGHIHGRLYNVSIGSTGETWNNLVIDPGVEYVSVTCTESSDDEIKNVHIFGGVCGTYDNPETISIPTRNNALLEVKPSTKTEILV